MKAAPSELTTFYKPKIRILACRLCSHILWTKSTRNGVVPEFLVGTVPISADFLCQIYVSRYRAVAIVRLLYPPCNPGDQHSDGQEHSL
jgi:hypothetical protein